MSFCATKYTIRVIVCVQTSNRGWNMQNVVSSLNMICNDVWLINAIYIGNIFLMRNMTIFNWFCSYPYLIWKWVFSRRYWASSSLPGWSRSATVAYRMSFSCSACSVVIRRERNFFTTISIYGGYCCNLLLVWERLN